MFLVSDLPTALPCFASCLPLAQNSRLKFSVCFSCFCCWLWVCKSLQIILTSTYSRLRQVLSHRAAYAPDWAPDPESPAYLAKIYWLQSSITGVFYYCYSSLLTYLCVCVQTQNGTHVEDNLEKQVFSSHHVGFRDQTQVARLGGSKANEPSD